MADPLQQPTAPPQPAWVRPCQWLWARRKVVWSVLIVGIIVGVLVNYLTSTSILTGTPLGTIWLWIRDHPLLAGFVGVGLLGLTGGLWLINRLYPAPASQTTSPRPQAILLTGEGRRRFLARLHSLYQDTVEQSLWGMSRMELGLERTFEATAHPALSDSYRPAGVRETIAPGTPILSVYQKAGDGLLILGKPGAGKSTLLYDLSLALTEQAERDATQLPPVLVSLTSWAQKRLPLLQWLAEELQTKYQVQASGWLQADQLLPLLDGLDEMAEEARSACIEAINTYRQDHPLPIVVSSRSAEYFSQVHKLHLQSAIKVQPLTTQQVQHYLEAGKRSLEAVRAVLGYNPVLQELLTTPLLLSVVIQAYYGKAKEDLPQMGTAEEQQRQVFRHYVQRMLERPRPHGQFTSHQTRSWLIWLAQQMKQHQITEFYLERLQPTWLPTKRSQTLYGLLLGLVGGLFSGLFYGLFVGLHFGLFYGLTTAALS